MSVSESAIFRKHISICSSLCRGIRKRRKIKRYACTFVRCIFACIFTCTSRAHSASFRFPRRGNQSAESFRAHREKPGLEKRRRSTFSNRSPRLFLHINERFCDKVRLKAARSLLRYREYQTDNRYERKGENFSIIYYQIIIFI